MLTHMGIPLYGILMCRMKSNRAWGFNQNLKPSKRSICDIEIMTFMNELRITVLTTKYLLWYLKILFYYYTRAA